MLNIDTKYNILDFISHNDMGCSSREISSNLKLDRVTLTKYLNVLYSEGALAYKNVGMAKLWYMENSPVLKSFTEEHNGTIVKELFDGFDLGVVIVNQSKHIVWTNSVLSKMHRFSNIKGKHIHKVKHFCTKDECSIDEVFEKGKTKRCTTNNKEITHFPLKDKQGNVSGALSIIRNF